MYRVIRISFAVAYHGNPNVGEGTVDVKEGEGYKTKGFEISPDHKSIFVEPYVGMYNQTMNCTVIFRLNLFTKVTNLLTGKPAVRYKTRDISKRTRILLKNVKHVMFLNDWDDSCYSFESV